MVGFNKDIDEKELEPPFDGLRGEYVMVGDKMGNLLGRVEDVREGIVYLRPHQNVSYNPDRGPTIFMSEESARIRLEDVIRVTPFSKDSAEAYCEFQNKENQKNEATKLPQNHSSENQESEQ